MTGVINICILSYNAHVLPLKIKKMITVAEFKKLHNTKTLELTDEEIEAVINLLYQLSDLLFEIWIEEKNK